MNEKAVGDIKASFGFAVRVALDHGVSHDELVVVLREAYTEAEKARAAKGEVFKAPNVGSFVTYWHSKKGPDKLAHVLHVHEGGRLDIRVHMGVAEADLDVKDVPYSEKPTKEHWSQPSWRSR